MLERNPTSARLAFSAAALARSSSTLFSCCGLLKVLTFCDVARRGKHSLSFSVAVVERWVALYRHTVSLPSRAARW